MPIHVSYFGKQNPKTAISPISSYQWDKPPFGEEPKIDWKTGKVRSALYQEEKPVTPEEIRFRAFDIRVGVSDKVPVIQVWMPKDTSRVVSRNGYDISAPEIYTGLEKEGWQNLLLPMDKKVTYYVYVNVVGVEDTDKPWPTGEDGATWELTAVTNPVALTALQTIQQTPTFIAMVVNGIAFQITHGRVNTYYSMPDGEALPLLNKSLEHPEGGDGIQQVQGFNSDTRIASDEVKAATIRDFMMRFDLPDGRAQVSYLDGEGAAEYVFPHGTIIWGRVVPDGDGGFSQYRMTWDLPNRIWVEEVVPSDPSDPIIPDPTIDCSIADSVVFPSSVDDEEFPSGQDVENPFGGGGDEDEEQFPSKVDVCW